MADLIERQAAIDAIEELPTCYNGYSDTYDKAYIIGVLEEVPSAQPEPKWISCKDRLPEKEGRYLVWAAISFIPDHVDDPDTYYGITIASYFEQFGSHHWYGDHVEDVVAWMPLSEPWRGESDGKK